jgi:hypothetical protein
MVDMPASDPTAVLRIGDGNKFATPAFLGASARVTLAPGDYIVTIDNDGSRRPAADAPFTVTTDVDAIYMSAGPWVGDVRHLVSGTGRIAITSDPKDPWPPELATTGTAAEAEFTNASPIVPAMSALLDADFGKGAGDGNKAPPAIHALLIGIDAYTQGPGKAGAIYKPLRGCVSDILEVERFLRHDVGVPAERITRLIAPAAGGPGSQEPPSLTSRPTYDNIVSAWRRVMETASKGDVVYIHYSGHGGRSATLFPAFKSNGLDESIVPCDINEHARGRYLRDIEVAVLLKQMAQRELVTTIVLDSCHSGSTATRGDEVQARRGDTEDRIPRAGESADNSAVASRAELEAMAKHLASTPRGADESWRIDPGGAASSLTTVIAACRPHEAAYEYAVDGKNRRGVLTYFWLDTLRQRGGAATYRTVYRQVFARVQNLFQEQAPLLLGTSNRLVLGTATLAQPASIAILDVSGEMITLAAGASSLLRAGTQLAVIPCELLPELVNLPAMTQIEVISVGATSSRARVVGGTGSGQPITLSSQAVILAHAPTLRRDVRLLSPEPLSPEALAANAALEQAIAADTTNVIGLAATESAHYQVAIDRSTFAILDPSGHPLPHLRPPVRVDGPGAVQTIKDRLVHLARFHNVLELTNTDPNSPLAGKLDLTLHTAEGDRPARVPWPMCPGIRVEVDFYLRIRNRSTRAMSLAIFDLAPDWSIEYVNRQSPLTVESGAFVDFKLTTSLPPGYEKGRDVLKVIGTLDQADFDWLTMEPLDRPYVLKRGTRTPKHPLDQMMALLHEPPTATRTVRAATSPTFGWTEAQIALEVLR